MSSPAIVWFRIDLRLADNPALTAAVKHGGAVVPVFIWEPEEEAPWAPGAASRWWLHQSLKVLEASLDKIGAKLIIRRGPSLATLRALVKETGATAVFWNRRYEPAVVARDALVKKELRADGLMAESFNAALLREPWTIKNKSGKPFQVFTPYWRHCLEQGEPEKPLTAPKDLAPPAKWPKSEKLELLELEPKIKWAEGMRAAWQPGEAGAIAQLKKFSAHAVTQYAEERDRPDHAGTSRLSPHLHFGEISPRQIWQALVKLGRNSRYLTEIGWREFAHHLLFHFPQTATEPLRPDFKKFPWRKNKAFLKAWQHGRTGYPMVDAGMRELWAIGWMHNRVRMIAASFLVKDLLLSWQEGAAWFWDTLVDADLAQNTLGWQWSAGCGADSAPYFRIFNPTTQGEKFDPQGKYIRKWCAELEKVPDKFIHAPGEGIKGYPGPIISHTIAREMALEAFAELKKNA